MPTLQFDHIWGILYLIKLILWYLCLSKTDDEKYNTFGKSGAGKGTQAALLRDAFQLVHISTGDLFRYNIGNNTSLGAFKSYMDQWDLVPDEVTIKMLEAEVGANPFGGVYF